MRNITMKGTTSESLGLQVMKSERPLLPEQLDEYRTISGRDGKQHIARELGNTQLRVQFFTTSRSPQAWIKSRDKITAWLFSREEEEITFDDEPGVVYIGKVVETDIPERYMPSLSFWVTFTMHPFKYGNSINKAVPLTSGASTIKNDGTFETPYRLTINPSSNINGFVIGMNGEEITYTGTLSSSAVITIDTDTLELRVNGALRVLEVSGWFSDLLPGNNLFTSNIPGTHTIEYRERSI